MTTQSPSTFNQLDRPAQNTLLARALQADSIFCGVCGLAAIVGSDTLAGLTGLPTLALIGMGVVLLGYASLLWWEIGALPIRKVGWAVVTLNLVWVAASAALLISGRLPMMSFSWWLVLDLAIIVDLFATVQIIVLTRRAPRRA